MNCLKLCLLRPSKRLVTMFGPVIQLDVEGEVTRARTPKGLEPDANIGFKLSDTPKNRVILNSYGVPHKISFPHKEGIEVLAAFGSSVLNESTLYIISYQVGWEVELAPPKSSLLIGLKKKLCSIDLGVSEYTLDAFFYNMAETLPLVLMGLVNLGNWGVPAVYTDVGGVLVTPGEAKISDLRPFVNVWKLLTQELCLLGYKFNAPLLEKQQPYAYLLADFSKLDFLESCPAVMQIRDDYIHFVRATDPDPDYSGAATALEYLLFYTINDPCIGTLFGDPAGDETSPGYFLYSYYKGLSGTFKVDFKIIVKTDVPSSVLIGLWEDDGAGGGDGDKFTRTFATDGTIQEFTFSYFTDEDIYDGQYYYIPFLVGGGPGTVIVYAGSSVTFTSVNFKITNGLIIKNSSLMSCGVTLSNILDGVAHLYGKAMFIVDEANKLVSMLHKDKVTVWDEAQPESYYRLSSETVRVCNVQTKLREQTAPRIVDIKFQADDEYIKSQHFENLWAIRYDRGENFIGDEISETNPLFAPTLNGISLDIGNIEIPHLWDNDSHEQSTNIEPRILLYAGYIEQGITDALGATLTLEWAFEGTTQTFLPFLYQYTNIDIIAGDIQKPITNLAYGGVAQSLVTIFWSYYLSELTFAIVKYCELAEFSSKFEKLNFRNILSVDEGYGYYEAKLLEINVNEVCSYGVISLVIQPLINEASLYCAPGNIGNPYCFNAPTILVVFIPEFCVYFDFGPGAISPILTDDLFYRIPGLGIALWQPYTPPSQFCGCDYGDALQVFSGCLASIAINTVRMYMQMFDCTTSEADFMRLIWQDATTITVLATGYHEFIITLADILAHGPAFNLYLENTTPLGVMTYSADYIYTGNGIALTCADIDLISETTSPNLWYDIEVRRLTTYADGCPATDVINVFTHP